jgi:O-antigen/teichoic acid export membrane protein
MWLPVLALLWTIQMMLEQYLVSQHKVAVASVMKEIVLRAANILLLLCCWAGWISFSAFFIGSVLVFVLPITGMWLTARRTKHFTFSTNWSAFSRKEYKELIHFAWYHFLSTASQASLGFLDAILIVPLANAGASSLAVYTPAVFLSTLSVIPYRAMISASFPVLNRAYIDNDMVRVRELFRRSGINIWIVALAMALMIACNLNNVVALMPEGKGMEALPKLVLILLIGKLIDMGTGLNNELLSISRYYKVSFYASLILLVSILFLERWLIPLYGNVGAAWGATISLGIFNLMKMGFLWKKFGLHSFNRPMLLAALAAVVTFLIGWFLPVISLPVIDACIRTAIILVIYTGLLILLKPSPDLNTYLIQIRKNKRLF